MDRISTLNMNHIPHFARAAFPCWSILHQFPNAARYVQVRNFEWDEITSEWIVDLMKVFNAAGIQVVDYFIMISLLKAIILNQKRNGLQPSTLEGGGSLLQWETIQHMEFKMLSTL